MLLRASLVALCLVTPMVPALAQDQTLADIRQELSVVYVDIQRLKRELSTSGAPQSALGSGTTLDRVNAIEVALQKLTAKTEQLEFRIDRVVKDGSNQIEDLEFRLCELETSCDIGQLKGGTTLGGEAPSAPAPVATPDPVVIGEQGDFDAAAKAFDAGNYAEAALAFEKFNTSYPGSPLASRAHLLRGDALAQQAQWSGAARAYLDAFSTDPQNADAPGALVKLGVSLNALGQKEEACLTLAEVEARYPNSGAVNDARAQMTQLTCS